MQIQLKQRDIEHAIAQYLASQGITRPVQDVTFTVSRKGGTTIDADVELADAARVTPTYDQADVPEANRTEAVIPEVKEAVAEVNAEEPPFESDESEANEPVSLFGK